MKVNGIDIRKYNAVQLTAEVLPPSLSVNYEIITGAIVPLEFDTDMPLGQLKLCIYFRGDDRNRIVRSMSSFLQEFAKSAVLEVDGYKGKFKAFAASSDYEKMKVKTRYKLNLALEGYFYDDEICMEYSGTSATIKREGTRKVPVVLEITAKSTLTDFLITGFEDDITISSLAAGKTIVIDGEAGPVTVDGTTAFETVSIWTFPELDEKETNLTFSSGATVKVRYKPMWI